MFGTVAIFSTTSSAIMFGIGTLAIFSATLVFHHFCSSSHVSPWRGEVDAVD
jgi:hypothetical protein